MQPDIELHIEELILRGFPASQRVRIGAAVELELTRLCIEQGIPPALLRGGELPALSPSSFHLKQGAGPELLGAQVARSVYEGLSKTELGSVPGHPANVTGSVGKLGKSAAAGRENPRSTKR
jgi:hypothetical protein